MEQLPRWATRKSMIEILEQIHALPEVSAFQFGFVKGAEEFGDLWQWHAILNGHPYEGASVANVHGPEKALEYALESLQKGIADAKRHSGEG